MSRAGAQPDAIRAGHRALWNLVDRAGLESEVDSRQADRAHGLGPLVFRTELRCDFDVRTTAPVLHLDPSDVVVPRCRTELFLEGGAELRVGVGVSAAAARRECDCAQTGNSNGFR